ncbi:hypothetical protein [Streptomyces sp. S186]|uniref:hypothetical protein n=1 Tax=Streptomyces sp. S186 TaxID=3434395 RepID=UPI003F66DE4D
MKKLTRDSRVLLAPFTHRWRSGHCVLAYAREDTMAVVATVPVPDVPDGDPTLWDVAGGHLPTNVSDEQEAYGRWIIDSGWGLSVMPHPEGLTVDGSEWTVAVARTAMLKVPAYNSDGVHVGRLTFADPEVMARARALIA